MKNATFQHRLVSLVEKGRGYQCYLPFKCKEIANLSCIDKKFVLVHNENVLNLISFCLIRVTQSKNKFHIMGIIFSCQVACINLETSCIFVLTYVQISFILNNWTPTPIDLRLNCICNAFSNETFFVQSPYILIFKLLNNCCIFLQNSSFKLDLNNCYDHQAHFKCLMFLIG